MYKAFEGPLNEDPRLIAKQAEIYTTLPGHSFSGFSLVIFNASLGHID